MRANLRTILAIVRNDLALWRRRPITIIVTVAPAIFFLLVILMSAGAVGRNPVALVLLDRGPHAQALAAAIRSSDAFRVRDAGVDEAGRMLGNLDVAAVVTIPADFEQRFNSRQADPVTIRINNLNLDFTNDLRRSLPAAITRFYAQQPVTTVSIAMRESDLRIRDVSLVQFELVPNVVLLLLVAGAVNGGLGVAAEFEAMTMKELLLSPASRWAIITGKLLAAWVTSLLVGGVVLGLAAVTGMLQPNGWFWLPTIGIAALIALASAGIGTALGARLRSVARVSTIAINLSIWLFFLSGGIGVAAFLPTWVQTIAAFTPTFYGVHALQMSIFYSSTDLLGRDVAVLAVTAVVALALGSVALRKSTFA